MEFPIKKHNIRVIAHACTKRKDDIFMQRRLYIGKADTALDIFRFAVFYYTIIHCQDANEDCLKNEVNASNGYTPKDTPKNVEDLSEVKEPQNADTYYASTMTIVVLIKF